MVQWMVFNEHGIELSGWIKHWNLCLICNRCWICHGTWSVLVFWFVLLNSCLWQCFLYVSNLKT